MANDPPLPSSLVGRMMAGASYEELADVRMLPQAKDLAASEIRQHSKAIHAKTMLADIDAELHEFESSLAEDEEVGAVLASFGEKITITVTKVEYRGAQLVIFTGEWGGQKVKLVQHTSQINLLLVRIKVSDRKGRRIGFGASTEDQPCTP